MLVATSHCVVVEHNYERVALSFFEFIFDRFLSKVCYISVTSSVVAVMKLL